MAGLPPEVRQATDALDSVGNTTAAVAKGFAIALGSSDFPRPVLGIHLGGRARLDRPDPARKPRSGSSWERMFPFLFAGLTMNAVGRAASRMIDEVRRQFREIPGLREGDPEASTGLRGVC